jgi:putative transposase
MEEQSVHEQHSVHHLLSPIIFCPKRRRKVLGGPVQDRLSTIIEQVAEENQWPLVRLAIQPDPVQLFMQATPSPLPTEIPRLLKGRSSHLLREEFPHVMPMPSLWTRSTFSRTAGQVRKEVLEASLERQSCS